MSSGESLRSSGRSSQRFSEVLSHGPTAIPAREDVDAAISSALAVDDLGFRRRAHGNGEQPSDSRSQPRNIDGANSRPPYAGPTADPTRVPNAATTTATISVQHSAGVGVGGGGGDGGLHPRANGVCAGVASNSSNGGGGLLDWALWPLWGTIDALKWAGGTVNEVAVAPVMRMASPWGLAGSVLTTVKAFTPQRARDLARVVGNFGLNAAGLVQTPAGVEVLRSSGRATGSLSTAVSSPAGRQFLLESATGLVKLAEALDTPEAKNFIQQGAVVAARGMDALASRHTKIFVKDLADVIVRLVELANSREATILAAEFTVNVEHALEMEHMAGIARRAAANAAAGATADVDPGIAAGDAHAPPAGGDGTEPNLGLAEDVVGPASREPEANGGPVCAAGGEQTLDDLVREARAERAHRESGGTGGPRSAGHEIGGSDVSVLAGGGPEGCCPSRSGEARPSSNDTADANHRAGVTPVIRQANLAGDTPLRTFLGAAGGTAPVAPPPGDTSRSAPSSPRGWHAHAATAAAAAAAGAVPALPTLGGQCAGNRERASTVTGAGDDGVGGGTAEEACGISGGAGFTAGCRGGGENDGTESVLSGARHPAVEYERDGNARLPRFTSENFESVLRGQPLGLELQLEAPNEDSVDDTVARAASSRVPLEGASPPFPRVDAGNAPGNAVQETTGQGAPPGEGEGEGVSVPSTPGARGWKQATFACLLLFFAGDGLRHRWKAGFRGEKTAHENISMPPPPPTPGPPKPGSLATDGQNSVFGITFLPPTCKDPVSGATMAVWVAPSGPCLSPASVSSGGAGSTEGLLGGGGEPACSASFRLCSAAEVGARGGVERDATAPPDSCGFEGTKV